ncbi:acyl carrier protein [Thiolapillus sp.]
MLSNSGRTAIPNNLIPGQNMSVENKIRTFILENYLFTDDQSELKNDDSFLDQGILDSTGILEIIFFIEDEFKIKIRDEEMTPDNLDSVNKIVAFIHQKKS